MVYIPYTIDVIDKSVKNRILPTDPEIKCFLYCMFDMFGLVCDPYKN